MSRDIPGVYTLPAGSAVSNGDSAVADDLNVPLNDIAADLNVPRPVVAGGTGASSAAAALVNLGVTATAAEINVLDGVTASMAELNILDGVTASTAELNFVDGVTSAIQTQLDAKQAADAQLADLTTPGAIGVIKVSDGTNYDDITPGTTGQVLTGVTGDKPVFAAPATPAASTLLGTITTTSGTTATLGSLDLTAYKFLRIVASGVSTDNSTSVLSFDGDPASGSIGSAANRWYGGLELDLGSGAWWSSFGAAPAGGSGSAPSVGGSSSHSNATTSISFSISPGNFDNGSFRVYGVT